MYGYTLFEEQKKALKLEEERCKKVAYERKLLSWKKNFGLTENQAIAWGKVGIRFWLLQGSQIIQLLQNLQQKKSPLDKKNISVSLFIKISAYVCDLHEEDVKELDKKMVFHTHSQFLYYDLQHYIYAGYQKVNRYWALAVGFNDKKGLNSTTLLLTELKTLQSKMVNCSQIVNDTSSSSEDGYSSEEEFDSSEDEIM